MPPIMNRADPCNQQDTAEMTAYDFQGWVIKTIMLFLGVLAWCGTLKQPMKGPHGKNLRVPANNQHQCLGRWRNHLGSSSLSWASNDFSPADSLTASCYRIPDPQKMQDNKCLFVPGTHLLLGTETLMEETDSQKVWLPKITQIYIITEIHS